jgi:hypothetical protein
LEIETEPYYSTTHSLPQRVVKVKGPNAICNGSEVFNLISSSSGSSSSSSSMFNNFQNDHDKIIPQFNLRPQVTHLNEIGYYPSEHNALSLCIDNYASSSDSEHHQKRQNYQ